MNATDFWKDNGEKFVEVEIDTDKFVCVKKPLSGETYIMENEDGTLVYDIEGNFLDEEVDEEKILAFTEDVVSNR